MNEINVKEANVEKIIVKKNKDGDFITAAMISAFVDNIDIVVQLKSADLNVDPEDRFEITIKKVSSQSRLV